MKLYIVCLLVALACVAVMPAPAPQQIGGNVSASSNGPLTTLYDLATMFPSSVLSSAQNAMGRIPIVNIFPAALQSGIQVGKNVAEGMDHTLLGITGNRGGRNPFAALLNPLGLLGGGQNNNGGQVGGQFIGGQPNPVNGLGNLLNSLNPLNYLNGAAQNGQLPGGQTNPLGAIGNTLNTLNPLNMLQGAASQLSGQQNPNGNNPLNTLTNEAIHALNQLSPAALAQYLSGLQQNVQIPNLASNAAANFNPNGGSAGLTVSAGNVPVPVRGQNEEI